MERKYEFTGETKTNDEGVTLHQIRSLRDFSEFKAGSLGGWIEKEGNLSHEGNCWVYENSQIYGNSLVFGNSQIYENSQIYGNSLVFGNSQIFANSRVFGNSQIYGNSRVFGKCSKTPIYIQGLTWEITIADDTMAIGCQKHTIEAWNNFSDEEISKMEGRALEFWLTNKSFILAAANSHKVS